MIDLNAAMEGYKNDETINIGWLKIAANIVDALTKPINIKQIKLLMKTGQLKQTVPR